MKHLVILLFFILNVSIHAQIVNYKFEIGNYFSSVNMIQKNNTHNYKLSVSHNGTSFFPYFQYTFSKYLQVKFGSNSNFTSKQQFINHLFFDSGISFKSNLNPVYFNVFLNPYIVLLESSFKKSFGISFMSEIEQEIGSLSVFSSLNYYFADLFFSIGHIDSDSGSGNRFIADLHVPFKMDSFKSKFGIGFLSQSFDSVLNSNVDYVSDFLFNSYKELFQSRYTSLDSIYFDFETRYSFDKMDFVFSLLNYQAIPITLLTFDTKLRIQKNIGLLFRIYYQDTEADSFGIRAKVIYQL